MPNEHAYFVVKGPPGFVSDFDWSLGAPDHPSWGTLAQALQQETRELAENIIEQICDNAPDQADELSVREFHAIEIP